MKKSQQLILFTLVSLAVLLAACGSQPARQSPISSSAEPTLVPTAVPSARTTYTVERGEVIYDATFAGRTSPVIEEPLAFPIDGVVAEVLVKREDEVEAGEVLATLNTEDTEEALLLAQQAFTIAQARLETTQAQRQRERRRAEIRAAIAQLNLDQAIAQAGATPSENDQFGIDRLALQLELAQLDLDELNTDIDPALQADVEQAALRVSELEKLLADAVLTAPFSGQLLSFNLSPGYAVSAFSQIGSIADMEQLEVSANVRENSLEELSEDMPVLIMPANRPGEAVTGTIRQLPYPYGSGGGGTEAGEEDSRTRFSFDNLEDAAAFNSGDRVDIIVVITEKDDVLFLPPSAIRDFNGRKFVVVQDGDIQERVDVELGIQGNGRLEIISGLEEGQTIIGQ
ncbi:MAG: HlyD family efflux transporter periplasmic adaptor subunit [Anaerolineae bacterium]|nr:HlyD family efflux transporter periplasmic adaptor subunit [Anaerolineae bacterium]